MDFKKVFYPALFHEEDNGFWVSFPDIPEALTEGDNMDDAVEMAKDALGISLVSYEEEQTEFPKPSDPRSVKVENESEFVVMIELDYLEYKKKNYAKTIKKTVTIPEWLNEMALEEKINFSAVLQDGLKEKLKV